MRCDANETCWGNTVFCILRCAFWNIGTGYPHSGCLFFWSVFPFPVLTVLLSRFGTNQKRARTSITCIYHHHHHHTAKGGGAGEGRSNLCLFLVTLGNIGELFPFSCEPVSFVPTLLLCFYTYDTKPPCSFPRQRTPTHALPRPRVPFPPTFVRPCQTGSRTRRDEEGDGKGGIFIRVVREGRGG